jgi:hypothetical protein
MNLKSCVPLLAASAIASLCGCSAPSKPDPLPVVVTGPRLQVSQQLLDPTAAKTAREAISLLESLLPPPK